MIRHHRRCSSQLYGIPNVDDVDERWLQNSFTNLPHHHHCEGGSLASKKNPSTNYGMRSVHHGLNGWTIFNSFTTSPRLSSLAILFVVLALLFGAQRECEGFQSTIAIRTSRIEAPLKVASFSTDHMELVISFLPSSSFNGANVLEAYGELLRTHPLTTKSTTAGVLSMAGDAIAQAANKNTYDVKRGLVFGLFGVGYTGVFQHYWFPYLTSHVAEWGHLLHIWGDSIDGGFLQDGYLSNASPSNIALAAGKVVINQMLMIPGLYMPIFLILTSCLGGLDLEQAKARAVSLYFPLVGRNWLFWFPTQFIQFFAIPTEWHIPFLSTASLVWTIILSTVGAAASSSSTSTPLPTTPPPEPTPVVDDVTGTDTIRVVDVVKNTMRGETEQAVLGATTTVLLALFLAEATDTLFEASDGAEESQALLIATAGWIGWSLGPKFIFNDPNPSIEDERPEVAMARLPFESLQSKLDNVVKQERLKDEEILAADNERR